LQSAGLIPLAVSLFKGTLQKCGRDVSIALACHTSLGQLYRAAGHKGEARDSFYRAAQICR
jgi:hypothetical protein